MCVMAAYETLRWRGNAATGVLQLLDQTLLPEQRQEIDCRTVQQVWEAIRVLRVRGAPAIGVSAAYGVVLATQGLRQEALESFRAGLRQACEYLAGSRPTAVNLFWALNRMQQCGDAGAGEVRRICMRGCWRRRSRLMMRIGGCVWRLVSTVLSCCSRG